MTELSRRYWPWIVAFLLAGLLTWQMIDHSVTRIQIALAEEQTAIFEQMRQKAENSKSPEMGCLKYVVWYYPSGSKQTAGSNLDRVVERARRSAVREIISILRTRSGQDFGEDPQRWIEGLKVPEK